MGLDRLLRPKSIAVIGGGSWCENVIKKCQEMGFVGTIYPVHPNREKMGGIACFTSVEQLPQAPDAVFIGVNRHATIDIVARLNQMGAGGAICFASGFLEAEAEDETGADLQAALLQAAGDMTILGPNCYGFINYLDGALLWPDQHGGRTVDSGVAIITQSSNMAINLSMQKRGLPVAYVVTAGNQAQTGLSQISIALLEDPRVTALGLHIEGIDDLIRFQELAQIARKLNKPIVVLKVGASDQAQAATISHTASLAGSHAGANALFKRLGMVQIHNLTQFLETLKLLHVVGSLESNQIASMSCSGGEASLMADTALNYDVTFPDLNMQQKRDLRVALGPLVKLANPLDYHTYIWGDIPAMTQTFTAMMTSNLAMGLLILDFPRDDRCDPIAWLPVVEVIIAVKELCGRPMGLVASLPENIPEDIASKLIDHGVVPFCGLDDCLAAIEAAVYLGQNKKAELPITLPIVPNDASTMTENHAKKMLSPYGLTIPESIRCETVILAGQAADEIGYPVVLKGEGIAHKTEAGAVALNLMSQDQVITAAQNMPTDYYLVEQMVSDAVAELLVGVVLDPVHGYVLTIAAGGVLTELLKDSVSLILPITEPDINEALIQLRIAPLLKGFRGQKPAHMESITTAILAIQDFILAHVGQIEEVEINPLLCTPTGAIVADALIRMEK